MPFTEQLEGIIEYFDQRADADQPSGHAYPTPNEEMRLLMAAQEAEKKLGDLFNAANDLVKQIEGIEGAMKYGGDWRSKNGFRVKDLDAWVRLYVAVNDIKRMAGNGH